MDVSFVWTHPFYFSQNLCYMGNGSYIACHIQDTVESISGIVGPHYIMMNIVPYIGIILMSLYMIYALWVYQTS